MLTVILYLAVTVISISSHEVDTVAVFIPECPLIGQGTVGDSDVIVMVIGGEWTTMVVGHRVTYKDTQQKGRERQPNKVCYHWHKYQRSIFKLPFNLITKMSKGYEKKLNDLQ